MANKTGYRVVPSPARSELQQLALWFHQDWKLLFPDFHAGLTMYLENLPAPRRVVLGRELREFVEQNRDASARALTRRWLSLGAQGWQSSLDIRSTLEEFCRIVEGRS